MQNNEIEADRDALGLTSEELTSLMSWQSDIDFLLDAPDSLVINIDEQSNYSNSEVDIEDIQATLQEYNHFLLPSPPPPPPLVLPPPILTREYEEVRSTIFDADARRILAQRRNSISEVLDSYSEDNFDNLEDVKITLTAEAFQQLNVTVAKDDICCICFDIMKYFSIVLPCNHSFHYDCAKTWLLTYNYKCPLCNLPAGERYAHI